MGTYNVPMSDYDFKFNDNLKDLPLGRGCMIAGASVPVFAISLTITVISPDVEGFFANLIASLVITGIVLGIIACIYDYKIKRSITLTYVTQPHWKPDTDVAVITYGYDHQSKSYRIRVSPIIYLPSRRSMMDAWLAEQQVVEREFTNGEAVMMAARNLHRKLTNAGWQMNVVAWVEFHKRLPCWEYDSGKDIKEISIPSVLNLKKFNPNDLVIIPDYTRYRVWHSTFTEDGNIPPLRRDLQAKINKEKQLQEQERRREEQQRKREEQEHRREEQERRREEQEFKDAMRPLPAWARGEDGQVERKRNDFDIIDLNTADETTLRTLPGIGRVRAQAIVIHRRTNGDFSSVEDLLDVDGIGPDVLEKIREMVAV